MRCVVKFSDGSHINTAADRMEVLGICSMSGRKAVCRPLPTPGLSSRLT